MTFRQLFRRISRSKFESDAYEKTRISAKKNASPSMPSDERLQRSPRRRPILSLIRFLRKKSKTQNKASIETYTIRLKKLDLYGIYRSIYNFANFFLLLHCRWVVLIITWPNATLTNLKHPPFKRCLWTGQVLHPRVNRWYYHWWWEGERAWHMHKRKLL